MTLYETLLALSGETTVAVQLLAEDVGLIRLIKQKTPYDQLLEYVNENY